MTKKRIEFMITAFRDGFQSVYGARVLTNDFLPAVEAAVEAGITHFEAGGGARFQSLYFYCNEDAFAMMDAFRKAAGEKADLQTLARGINVVGLESQSSDVIRLHAKLFKKHGITTIRNFDALNDVNNLDFSGRCIHEAGLKHEICVSLMGLPPGLTGAHTPEFYIKILKGILDRGIPHDSVCFKDASGTTTPAVVYDTIKKARDILGQNAALRFHTHETAGTSVACYLAALNAGANAVDLSMAPCSGGTCQPDIVVLWHALRGTEFDLGVDIQKVLKAESVFKECMKDYMLPPEATSVEPMIPFSPMPGGALTANTQMMRDNDILYKFPEVIEAMGEVVKRGGFGTSVTPVSQFYFQQAYNNVMFGEWKKIARGYGEMVLGYFGKTPLTPDADIVKLAKEQLGMQPADKMPLEMNDSNPEKGLEAARKMLEKAGLPVNDENLFITATCKDKGITFLKGEALLGIRKKTRQTDEKNGYTVTVDNQSYSVFIEDNKAIVDGREYAIDVKEGTEKVWAESKTNKKGVPIKSPMPGAIMRIKVKEGAFVKSGAVLMVLESMKMEIEIKSSIQGSVIDVKVKKGDVVKTGQVLVIISGEAE